MKKDGVTLNLIIDNKEFKVTIKYRKKRGISYYVDYDSIVITAPYSCSIDYLKKVIYDNKNRIIDASNKASKRIDMMKYGSVLQKENYLFMGNIIPVTNIFIPYKKLFSNYVYIIEEIYNDTLKRLNVSNVKLVVKPLKSKWGSYNARTNVITINLYLMFFERPLIEYVICHEVCHIGNLSHDRKFHSDLDKICPNNAISRKKINDLTTLTRKLQALS